MNFLILVKFKTIVFLNFAEPNVAQFVTYTWAGSLTLTTSLASPASPAIPLNAAHASI